LKLTNDFSSGSPGSGVPVKQSLYRLDLSYIGTRYQGFQSQPSGMGIQDHIEKALAIFCRHPVRITSASRTDAGVHADDQVITFKSVAGVDSYRLVKSMNALLPADIRVKRALIADEDFHPIINCTGKAYKYSIWRSAGEIPTITPYSWVQTSELCIAEMQKAARVFVGTHDFTSFCAVDSSARTKTRNVREVVIFDKHPMLEIWVLGDGFLKQMVRNMVGALVAVGKGKISVNDLKRILDGRNRELAPATAPASGLCLNKIFYGDDQSISILAETARSGYNISLAGEWI
jgi:tRNA pseudouridine38-40 synthase